MVAVKAPKNPFSKRKISALIIVGAAIVFVIGFLAGEQQKGGTHQSADIDYADHLHGAEEATWWTCSMHPQIRQPEPGKCPICAMDLIPVREGPAEDDAPRTISMSKAAMMLAEIQTQKVKRQLVDFELPMTGKVDYDERQVRTISAWVGGRLERLFVDYTGVPVEAGDPMVEIYSPELYAAQEELLQALRTVEKVNGGQNAFMLETSQATAGAAREKLRLLGLTAKQIASIEKRGVPRATLEISSPISGIVIDKKAFEGMYVKTGSPIYTVADLSKVWAKLDVYEGDIFWIRHNQEVDIRTEAYGDEIFRGKISFVDPVLNERTRTVKVRVTVDNSDGRLKPNMFVRAVVKARLAGHNDEPWLVIPASAPLITGKRAIVYVRIPNQERPAFEGIEVKLGPRAGNWYVVHSGLEEGQEVVVNGNFKIDSALQLLAKESMMSSENGSGPDARGGVAKVEKRVGDLRFLEQLKPFYSAYFQAQQALAEDNYADAHGALKAMESALGKMDIKPAGEEMRMQWMNSTGVFKEALVIAVDAKDIATLRSAFIAVSDSIINIHKVFGHAGDKVYNLAFCPMVADNKGAFWLQLGEDIRNPYFGSAMLNCGEIRDTASE